jgi:hypothetical protein
MTTRTTLPGTGRDPPAALAARLGLRSDAPAPGHVDGAWWPCGDDLVAELPDLLATLRPRLGPIHRVTYHLGEWPHAPRGIDDAGRRVRLDGYRFKPAHSLDVLGVSGARIALLVVPPKTTRDAAYATIDTAAHAAIPSTVDELRTVTARAQIDRTEREAAETSWDSEGGAARG